MVFSGRQTIVNILLLLIPVATAQSQSAVDRPATSTISGKVTVGGKGVSGVVVGLVTGDRARSSERPTRFRSTTDEEGNYRITKVPPDTYGVIAASPAYVATEGRKSLVVGPNETLENIDIALQLGGVITGKVTDADGRPVIEEMVYVTATRAQRTLYFRNIRTDDRGIYRAYGVPAGSYTVSAGTDGSFNNRRERRQQRTYHPSAVDVAAAFVIEVREGSEATNVDITLREPLRTYTARGRIIDSDTTQPMSNTRVGVQTFFQNGSSSIGNVAESNKEGEFKVENLTPGKYAVYSEPTADSDWQSEATKFEVTDRDIEDLIIKTSRGASVSGVVVLEGTDDAMVRGSLLASRIVGITTAEGFRGRPNPFATINSNGSFRMSGIPAGLLMLELQARELLRLLRVERDGITYPRGLDIKERDQVTGVRVIVGHANGGIRGVINIPTGLTLPANYRLRVTVRRTDDLVPGSYIPPVEADQRGHFQVQSLLPGTYEITVTVFGNPTRAQPLPIPTKQTVTVANNTVAEIAITLQTPRPTTNEP